MLIIRPETPENEAAIRHVNEEAFGDTEEAGLVEKLRSRQAIILSLVAIDGDRVVGHILFSPVTVESESQSFNAVGLGPMATQSEISTPATPAGEERGHECHVARGAQEQAGIGPEDLDFAEVYDLATSMEFDWMEDIGICKPGEAERLFREGATTIGGRIPINPSGGVSSFGESIPAQALLQVCELITQLRGDAGPRQVADARVGLAINKGLANSISCIIVKK